MMSTARVLTLQGRDAFAAQIPPPWLLFPGNISLGPTMLESTSGQRSSHNELQLFLVESGGLV